jgi:predicted ATPase
MITRLEVDGFKSLRDFAVDLEPFTVFIGPNSAGKTNILDALELLSRLTSGSIGDAFKEGRGKSVDQFTRTGTEVVRTIRFAVEFLEHGDHPPDPERRSLRYPLQSRFRYELTIERRRMRSGAERLVARDERLLGLRREDETWMVAHPTFAKYAVYQRAGENVLEAHRPEPAAISPTQTALKAAGWEGTTLVQQNLQLLAMLDPEMRRLGGSSERIDSGWLAPDGSNLPTILAEAPPQVLAAIRSDLVSLVPGISTFAVNADGDDFQLEFELSGGDRLPARLVSAGTLRVLALVTALRMRPRPHALCIEEPENGIYPGRLRALLDLLQEATERSAEDAAREAFEERRRELPELSGMIVNQLPTQILVTTHSPIALAAFRSRPEHLRFVDMVRRNGHRVTRLRTVGESGRSSVAPREIDTLLQAVEVKGEDAR